MGQSLVIKIGSHVMSNADNKCAKIVKVAVERGRFFENLVFYHVAVVTEKFIRGNRE
jgi:hypothetical protein